MPSTSRVALLTTLALSLSIIAIYFASPIILSRVSPSSPVRTFLALLPSLTPLNALRALFALFALYALLVAFFLPLASKLYGRRVSDARKDRSKPRRVEDVRESARKAYETKQEKLAEAAKESKGGGGVKANESESKEKHFFVPDEVRKWVMGGNRLGAGEGGMSNASSSTSTSGAHLSESVVGVKQTKAPDGSSSVGESGVTEERHGSNGASSTRTEGMRGTGSAAGVRHRGGTRLSAHDEQIAERARAIEVQQVSLEILAAQRVREREAKIERLRAAQKREREVREEIVRVRGEAESVREEVNKLKMRRARVAAQIRVAPGGTGREEMESEVREVDEKVAEAEKRKREVEDRLEALRTELRELTGSAERES